MTAAGSPDRSVSPALLRESESAVNLSPEHARGYRNGGRRGSSTESASKNRLSIDF
mgnify:CR=1 FL=1